MTLVPVTYSELVTSRSNLVMYLHLAYTEAGEELDEISGMRAIYFGGTHHDGLLLGRDEPNGAVLLDGIGDKIEVSATGASALNNLDDMSLEIWISPRGDSGPVAYKDGLFSLSIEGSDLVWKTWVGGIATGGVRSSAALSGTASHVVATHSMLHGDRLTINGVEEDRDSSATGSMQSGVVSSFQIGTDGTTYLSAVVDEPAIYSTAVSIRTAEQHYKMGRLTLERQIVSL